MEKKKLVKCYVNCFGDKLWICLGDNDELLTSSNKNEATVFESVKECNSFIHRTDLGEVDGFEFV